MIGGGIPEGWGGVGGMTFGVIWVLAHPTKFI